MLEILDRIPTFVFCPGSLLVALVGVFFLVRRRTRLGITLVVIGAAMAVLFVVVLLLALRDLG